MEKYNKEYLSLIKGWTKIREKKGLIFVIIDNGNNPFLYSKQKPMSYSKALMLNFTPRHNIFDIYVKATVKRKN